MSSLFAELKRRNVMRVGAAYVVVGWIIMQVIDVVIEPLRLPEWTATLVLVLLLVGLPITLFLAWAFEMTPEGVKKTAEVDADKSITPSTGRKLNYVIGGALVLALGFIAWDKLGPAPEPTSAEVGAKTSIAVLPFADMSADGDQEYFGDGIAEEILNALVPLNELNVTSRTSAFSFKGQNLTIPDIASQLNVEYIVEGSVRSAGNRIRVTAQLIEVAGDTHLWSETYDRDLDDIFAIQDEISEAIAGALKVVLISGEDTADRPTRNLEAYQFYLRGRHLMLQRGSANLAEAVTLLEQAVTLDPNFAEGWADLGAALVLTPVYSPENGTRAGLVKGGEAADRALTLNPELAQAWAVKGWYFQQVHLWNEARIAIDMAIELNSHNETAWLWRGVNSSYTGHLKDAVAALEEAARLAPLSGVIHGNLASAKLALGDREGAEAHFEKSLAFGWNRANLNLAITGLMDGDPELTLHHYREWFGRGFGNETFKNNENLEIYIRAHFDEALREEAASRLREDVEDGYFVQGVTGSLLIKDGASFLTLAENSPADINFGLPQLWQVPHRRILNQPEIKDYLRNWRLVDYWNAYKWPDFCRPLGDDDFECS